MTRMPGGQSRWSAGKDLSWEPLRVERVCEVKYDHMQGDRFRHAAVFQRWRPDKPPADCTLRSARGHGSLRAREGVRRDGRRSVSCRPPHSLRCVVWIERLLWRAQRFGHVLEIHADTGPRAGIVLAWHRPAHRTDADARRPPDVAPASARDLRARPLCAAPGQFQQAAGAVAANLAASAIRRRIGAGTAARARARRAASDSAAATAHRRDPLVPVAPTGRAAGRASTGGDRCRREHRPRARTAPASKRA